VAAQKLPPALPKLDKNSPRANADRCLPLKSYTRRSNEKIAAAVSSIRKGFAEMVEIASEHCRSDRSNSAASLR